MDADSAFTESKDEWSWKPITYARPVLTSRIHLAHIHDIYGQTPKRKICIAIQTPY
jgi:hypothetical protein